MLYRWAKAIQIGAVCIHIGAVGGDGDATNNSLTHTNSNNANADDAMNAVCAGLDTMTLNDANCKYCHRIK